MATALRTTRAPHRVLFVGNYIMPDATPGALRAVGLARSFHAAGYQCDIAAAEVSAATGWLERGATRQCDEFTVWAMGEFGGPRSTPLRHAVGAFVNAGKHIVRWLSAQEPDEIAAVVLTGGYTPMALRTLRWCQRSGVPLIVDVNEWYDPRQCVGGRCGPVWAQAHVALRAIYPRADGIIAISSWLEEYYRRAGCEVVRVPPTVDVDDQKWTSARRSETTRRGAVHLAYAGQPGKKDDIAMLIDALRMAKAAGADVELTLIGPTVSAVKSALGNCELQETLGPAVRCVGRRPHNEVTRLVAEADFTVLMRPNLTYANAGFPTKLVESLSCGVPVIANVTSDIGNVVRDGREGFLVPSYSASDLAATLKKACELTDGQRLAMRQAAEARAREVFDFRQYVTPLSKLVEAIQAKRSDS